jgi:hypothetical protein
VTDEHPPDQPIKWTVKAAMKEGFGWRAKDDNILPTACTERVYNFKPKNGLEAWKIADSFGGIVYRYGKEVFRNVK